MMFLAFSESTLKKIKQHLDEIKGNAIVAVHDQHTGTFYAAHLANGTVVYIETCGPLTEEQAADTVAALSIPPSGVRLLDQELVH